MSSPVAPASPYYSVPLGLGPRRSTGLSSSFGLFLADLVESATDLDASDAERAPARAKLSEIARLSTRACEVVKARRRREHLTDLADKAARRAAEAKAGAEVGQEVAS